MKVAKISTETRRRKGVAEQFVKKIERENASMSNEHKKESMHRKAQGVKGSSP